MNKIIVLSGPSGSGKDTVRLKLEDKLNLDYLISTTTRKKRTNEINGESYHFISKKEFKKLIKSNNILEYTIFNNNYYGKQKKDLDILFQKKNNIITILETKGIDNILKYKDEFKKKGYLLEIYFLDISKDIIKKRMEDRGDAKKDIEKRLKNGDFEYFQKIKEKADYIIDANNTENKVLIDIVKKLKENN